MKQLSGILVATALVAVNAFAMDSAATTTMTATGTVMATGTMMKHDDKMIDKMADKMEHKMMLTDEEAAKITGLSGKEKVAALQAMLVEKGYLKLPKGAKMGTYGMMTKKAHMKMKLAMMKMMHDEKMKTASSTMTH